eukprot:1132661-Ditylum_brightwellii.AAC.1
MTSLQHFFGVINFLVIEEPQPEFVIEATFTNSPWECFFSPDSAGFFSPIKRDSKRRATSTAITRLSGSKDS